MLLIDAVVIGVRVFALVLAIIFFSSLLVTIGMYLYFYFKKSYAYANMLMPTLFLQSLIVLMSLSWILIMMNEGFDVNFYLNIDYTILAFSVAPVLIILLILDIMLQRKSRASEPIYKRVFRYILPTLTILVLLGCSLVFYFDINYFIYLNM